MVLVIQPSRGTHGQVQGLRGVSRNGEDTSIVITADTVADAESIASGRRVLVSRVVELEAIQSLPSSQPATTVGVAVQTPAVQTIQLTAKKWKLLKLVSGLGIIFGILILIVALSMSQPDDNHASAGASLFGFIVLLGSIGLYIFARFMAWWHHG